jgi:DNA-binding NarL/FixJ family response regulator
MSLAGTVLFQTTYLKSTLDGQRVVNQSEDPKAVNTNADRAAELSNPHESFNGLIPVLPESSDTLCIGWVDVSRLTRECMTNAVARAQSLFVILPFESVRDCIRHSGRVIDLIVYHSHLHDTVELDDISALKEAFASVQLVVLSDASSVESGVVREALTRGASGFVLTDSTGLQMVVSAISLVSSGGTFVPRDYLFMDSQPAQLQVQRQATEPGRLTQREVAVLGLMKHGKPNKIIANELGMSASTVKVHVRHIMRKMGAANRTQAALNADKLLGIPADRPRNRTV